MNAQELQNGLAQACGSENFYRHRLGNFIYTDGIQFLAENAGNGAYWLLDAIGSYQPMLRRISGIVTSNSGPSLSLAHPQF